MIREYGFSLINADITVALQSPKIARYIPEMRTMLAVLLGVAMDQISIKATTTEKLGFVGREEGIAAYVTVLLGRQ